MVIGLCVYVCDDLCFIGVYSLRLVLCVFICVYGVRMRGYWCVMVSMCVYGLCKGVYWCVVFYLCVLISCVYWCDGV